MRPLPFSADQHNIAWSVPMNRHLVAEAADARAVDQVAAALPRLDGRRGRGLRPPRRPGKGADAEGEE